MRGVRKLRVVVRFFHPLSPNPKLFRMSETRADFEVEEETGDAVEDQTDVNEDDYEVPRALKKIKGDYDVDVGNMLISRVQPIDPTSINQEPYLLSLATAGTQELVKHLFQLPTEDCDVGVIAVLPPPTTPIPREKPCPQPKPLSRWEKFAQRKGIQKHAKRDRLVWDERSEDWKPRYGTNKANNKEDVWLAEHRPSDDPSVDPWTRMKLEKKERVAKNKRQHVQNLIAASGQKLPGTIDLASIVKSSKPDYAQKSASKRGPKHTTAGMARADHAKVALHLAQQSTASMGKFDKLHSDEPQPKQSRIIKKAPISRRVLHEQRKKSAQTGNKALDGEKNVSLHLLSKVLETPKVNVNKAVQMNKRSVEESNRKKNAAVVAAMSGQKRKQRR